MKTTVCLFQAGESVPKIIASYLLLMFLLLSGCKHEKPVSFNSKTPVPKPDVVVVPFVPPGDSAITPPQMQNWFSCNQPLDSLANAYVDSFKTEDPQKRLRYQDDFSKEQDRICVLAGLTGGYKEYRWILANAGNPTNKALFDSTRVGQERY